MTDPVDAAETLREELVSALMKHVDLPPDLASLERDAVRVPYVEVVSERFLFNERMLCLLATRPTLLANLLS